MKTEDNLQIAMFMGTEKVGLVAAWELFKKDRNEYNFEKSDITGGMNPFENLEITDSGEPEQVMNKNNFVSA